MNKYAMGGDEDDPPYQPTLLFNPETGSAYVPGHAYAPVGEIPAASVTAYGPNPVRDAIYSGQEAFLRGAGDIGLDIASLIPETAPIVAARDAYQAYRDFGEGNVWGGVGHSALSLAGAAPLFPRLSGALHSTGRGALRNATSHASKVREAASESARAIDATRAGRNASRKAVGDAYEKYIALLDKMETITDADQMTAAREEAETLLKELKSNRKDLRGDWFKLQGEKIANLWNKTRRGVANANESAWKGITGNKNAPAVTPATEAAPSAENATAAAEGAASNAAATGAETAANTAAETVKKTRRFWPVMGKIGIGTGVTGGLIGAGYLWNKYHGETDATKEFDAAQNGGSEFSTMEDFLNGFGKGGPMNRFDGGGPKYGRTSDGQFVQIIERTDGNGTTWKQYIPADEDSVMQAGTIAPAEIISLPEVRVTPEQYGTLDAASVVGLPQANVYGTNLPEVRVTSHGNPYASPDAQYYFGTRRNLYNPGNVLDNLTVTNPGHYGDNMLQMVGQNYLGHSRDFGYGNGIAYFGQGEDAARGYNFDDDAVSPVDWPRQPIYDLGSLGDAVVYGERPRHRTGSVRTSAASSANVPEGPAVPTLLSDTDLDAIIASTQPNTDSRGVYVGHGMYMPATTAQKANDAAWISQMKPDNLTVPELTRKSRRKGFLRDFDTRLLSPAIDVAMGAYNLLTPADHYDYTPINPNLPTGRILLQDQRYMPMDMNAVANRMQAQNTANARAIMNSGAGPATDALINAADYTGQMNLGNTLGSTWQANNQERNRVIAANNQNAATRAQFYRDLDSQRAQILNNAAMYNQRNALQVALLNNQAEQDKYNSVAASVNSVKKFLNDYGWERMNRNMVNTNRANLGYGIDQMNRVVYDRNGNPVGMLEKGGFLKPYKKK